MAGPENEGVKPTTTVTQKMEMLSSQIEEKAFHLFAARTAVGFAKRGVEQIAMNCFRDAESFLTVAKNIRSGELSVKPLVGKQLATVSAPNLKPTHPLNMVSQRFGNINRVKKIYEQLMAEPTLEKIEEFDWGKPEIETARLIFPTYCESK